MEASRITFDSKTLAALQNPTLSAKRKKELRFKALGEWIAAHPYGTVLSGKEFRRVGNFSSDISANSWLWRQAKSGRLIKHEANAYQSFYEIPGKVTTRKLQPETAAKEPEMDKFPQPAPQKTYTFAELEALAMKFDFYASGNATIPGFLLYVQAVK
jgi:hypothetical protein